MRAGQEGRVEWVERKALRVLFGDGLGSEIRWNDRSLEDRTKKQRISDVQEPDFSVYFIACNYRIKVSCVHIHLVLHRSKFTHPSQCQSIPLEQPRHRQRQTRHTTQYTRRRSHAHRFEHGLSSNGQSSGQHAWKGISQPVSRMEVMCLRDGWAESFELTSSKPCSQRQPTLQKARRYQRGN